MKGTPSGPLNAPCPLLGSDTPTPWRTFRVHPFRMRHGLAFSVSLGPMTRPLLRSLRAFRYWRWDGHVAEWLRSGLQNRIVLQLDQRSF
jgi:hypothetical protein